MHGNKGQPYTIEYLAQVVEQDIPALPKKIRDTIRQAIETRLMADPIRFGKPLQYSLKGHRRLRVGHYRVVYRIHYKHYLVTVIAIKHRKEVYENC